MLYFVGIIANLNMQWNGVQQINLDYKWEIGCNKLVCARMSRARVAIHNQLKAANATAF